MSKIAGEINAEMMHPKVIHEQRKALFAEMVRKTGSQQSVLDRLLQEIQFLRDHEGGPMDEEVIDILRGKVAELEAENTLHKSAMDNLAAKLTEAERQRDQLREQVATLREALKDICSDYEDRFDMGSPSTNPGMKFVVKQAKEALDVTEPKP